MVKMVFSLLRNIVLSVKRKGKVSPSLGLERNTKMLETHFIDRGLDDILLWPFAVKHAVWIYNRVPTRQSGLTPLELLTKSKVDHRDILRAHVWGCPAIVLEPQLQNNKKLPK